MAMLGKIRRGNIFRPSTLSGIYGEWYFNEGSGNVIPNRAATGRTGPYINIFGNVETQASLFATNVVGTTTVVNNQGTGHDGATPAAQFTFSSASSMRRATLTGLPSGEYTFSCYVKSRVAGVHGVIGVGINNSTSAYVSTTDSWQRLSYTLSGAAPTGCHIRNNPSSPVAGDILVSGAQLELASSASTWQRPENDIVAVNSTTETYTWQNGGLSMTDRLLMVGKFGASDQTTWTAHFCFLQSSANLSDATTRLLFSFGATNWIQLETSAQSAGSFVNIRNQSARTANDVWHVWTVLANGTTLTMCLDGIPMFVSTDYRTLSLALTKTFGRVSAVSYSLLYTVAQSQEEIQLCVQYLREQMAARSQTMNTPRANVIWQGDSHTARNPGFWTAAKTAYPQPTYQANLGLSGALTSSVATVVFARGVKNILFLHIGTNNLATIASSDGGGVVVKGKVKTLCDNYRIQAAAEGATSLKIVVVTCLPRTTLFNGGVNAAAYETERTAFNNAVVSDTSFYDYRVDVHLDNPMGTSSTEPNNTTYYSDGTHMNQAGIDRLQPLINAVLTAELT